MTQFHNPYHFVPLGDSSPGSVNVSEIGDPGAPKGRHVTHDRYVDGAHSGRLICRLEVKTALLSINTQRHPISPEAELTKVLEPFELDHGVPALAASGLRGMLASVAEAASNSALRVLNDAPLSHRVTMNRGLSAVGRLVERGGVLKLQPLTLPDLEVSNLQWLDGKRVATFNCKPDPAHFAMWGKDALRRLKGYILEHSHGGQPWREAKGPKRRSYSSSNQEYWYARLGQHVDHKWNHPKVKSKGNWGHLLGVEVLHLLSTQQYGSLPEGEKQLYTRGVLRLFKTDSREDIPKTKKHEHFIPIPEAADTGGPWAPDLDVTEALRNYHKLAAEVHEKDSDYPYGVIGNTPAVNLQAGDLVYFRLDETNPRRVAEVTVSAIWRRGNQQTFDYFPKTLLPLSDAHPRPLSLAEQLFGVVEEREQTQPRQGSDTRASFALAGRVRVSMGRLSSSLATAYKPVPSLPSLSARPLQQLATPKPPSPALYFRHRTTPPNQTGVKKGSLNPNEHLAQGRKTYLRRGEFTVESALVRQQEIAAAEQEQSLDSFGKQHTSIEKAIAPGAVFYFHIDFDNLSEEELNLLCYALNPSESFLHQFGHAKPLGFGNCKVTVAAMHLVDRANRYKPHPGENNPLLSNRYSHGWQDASLDESELRHLQSLYPRAFETRNQAPAGTPSERASEYRRWAAEHQLADCTHAIELLGSPSSTTAAIKYPPNPEGGVGEHFGWFVANDRQDQRNPQHLRPIEPEATQVPTLREFPPRRPR